MKPPAKIYLQWYGVDSRFLRSRTLRQRVIEPNPINVTWCVDQINDSDIAYVRADLVQRRAKRKGKRT